MGISIVISSEFPLHGSPDPAVIQEFLSQECESSFSVQGEDFLRRFDLFIPGNETMIIADVKEARSQQSEYEQRRRSLPG